MAAWFTCTACGQRWNRSPLSETDHPASSSERLSVGTHKGKCFAEVPVDYRRWALALMDTE
eukprot:3638130-Amphidinium_carterae.1